MWWWLRMCLFAHVLLCVCIQMWACALGHQAAAVLLYRWSSAALGIPDSLGRLPLAVAHSRGHTRLARCLEELHTHSQTQEHTPDTASPPYRPLSPLSSSPDTGNTHTLCSRCALHGLGLSCDKVQKTCPIKFIKRLQFNIWLKS